MEIRQSSMKIDSLIRELNNFINRMIKVNSGFSKYITKIESQTARLKRNADEYLTNSIEQNNNAEFKGNINENIFFEKKQLELLSSIQDNIKDLKKDSDEYGLFIKRSREIKKEIESLKEIIEKDILINIELNNEYASRTNHIYEFPPQLIDNLNTAYKNICIAKEGIDAMEVYGNIINDINKLC